ncbi:MAG TPA: septal ring lytic transglycosylase RlpA family protein [Thermoanaerobaculia bacterium]|nr:septal ring lytic transglycosylase RlpA family protein [Thermoanaerobaculia bacterium]
MPTGRRLPRVAMLAGAAYLVLVAWQGTEAPAPLLARQDVPPVAVSGPALPHLESPVPDEAEAVKPEAPADHGVASWYGRDFHGRSTASGEPFDMHGLTAAHRTLPFGTPVEVRNPANGRSVVVRINDRGPHTRRRLIDLSYAAARDLGIAARGTAPVELRILR